MNFIKLKENAILPKRATKNSAGYDLYCNETVTIRPNETVLVKTGIAYENMRSNEFGLLALRSGTAYKRPLILKNGVGILDADYDKEIKVMVYNTSDNIVTIDEGERIAQIVFQNYLMTSDDIKSILERENGFGSTGER